MSSASIFDPISDALGDRSGQGRLRYFEDGRWEAVPATQASETVRHLAAGLVAFGVGRDDRVAVLTGAGPEGWIGELAALACGAVPVPVDPACSQEILYQCLRESRAVAALVATGEGLEGLLAIRPELPDLDVVLLFEDGTERDEAVPATLVDRACALGADRLSDDPGLLEELRGPVRGGDPAFVLYASRRDAVPRAALISHDNLRAVVDAVGSTVPMTPADRLLTFLPAGEVTSRPWILAALFAGATVAWGGSSPSRLDALEATRPTISLATGEDLDSCRSELWRRVAGSSLTGAMTRWALSVGEGAVEAGLARGELRIERSWKLWLAERLVLAKARRATGGALRFFVSNVGTVSEETASFLLAVGNPVLEGFGIPETCGALFQNTPSAFRRGTRGRPIRGVEIRLAETGVVEVRGPLVMKGYQSPGEELPRGVAADGWLATEIRGRLDPGRFLTIDGS